MIGRATPRRFRPSFRRDQVYRTEKRYIRGDGETVWVALQSVIVRDDAGEPRYAVTTMQNITDRKLAEEALRRSEERFQFALEAASAVGTWDWDIKNDLVYADERFAQLYSVDPERAVTGAPVAEFIAGIHPDDRERTGEAIQHAINMREAFAAEYRFLQPDGSVRWVIARGRAYYDEEGSAVRFPGVAMDITDRKRAEEALRDLNETLERRVEETIAERQQAEEQLRQAQKMEAVGQLTGGIAHDFNNLLTVVVGNIDMGRRALEVAGGDPRTKRAMDNALRGAERATTLTQRLHAFSRRQPLEPKALDVDKLILGMSDLLNRALGETIKLEIVSSPGLWQVEADPNQLEAAILNLAVNARDAMPDGGALTIETGNARIDEAYTAAHAEVATGNYVMIAVTDVGCGMAKETLGRVFEPFFTTKEIGKGTGLRLSQVYGFVKQSGGHVKLYSEEGEGTTVKIYLPRLMSESAAEELDEATATPAIEFSQSKETVLVVEDDDDVRAYTVELLREIGYRVLEAHDGPSALRLLERQEEPIELLFTDIVLPGMSGRELAEEARKRQPDVKILFTSGYSRNAIVHGGRLDSGVDLIVKPFTYQGLARKVRDILDTGRSGRLLIFEDDKYEARSLVSMLAGTDYSVDVARRTREVLSRVRANGSYYGAVIINADHSDRIGKALASELRALHIDLPLLLITSGEGADLRERFAEDRCISIISEPGDTSQLIGSLVNLGVRCGTVG